MQSDYQPPQNATPATLVDTSEPIRVVIVPPRGSWIGRALRWTVTVVLALAVIGALYGDSSKLTEEYHSLSKHASNKVAIIRVEGTIMGDESYVKDQIDQVREDDDVQAVIVRVNSPGGTVTGSDYIYHRLKKLADEREIPLVVSMGGIAASGGYYVAMAAGDTENTIYAEPTTWTGSIGVIIPHYNVAKLLESWDIQDDSIASNPLKMMGSPTRDFPEPIKAEEQKILEGLVASSFADFKEIVLASRSALRKDKEKQDVVFTGRIFTAKQAKENLLVDRLGFIEDAIDRAVELASLDRKDVKVVQYKKPAGALDQILFGPQGKSQPLNLASLLDWTVPKAYYLCTWMPALASATALAVVGLGSARLTGRARGSRRRRLGSGAVGRRSAGTSPAAARAGAVVVIERRASAAVLAEGALEVHLAQVLQHLVARLFEQPRAVGRRDIVLQELQQLFGQHRIGPTAPLPRPTAPHRGEHPAADQLLFVFQRQCFRQLGPGRLG